MYFKNLKNNETVKKYVKVNQNLKFDLKLDSEYTIKYENKKKEVYGYIEKIRPLDYSDEKVFLTLNKNRSFRQMFHILNETIEDDKVFYSLYYENNLFRFKGEEIEKISLITGKKEKLKEKFIIDNNQVIKLGGDYLINSSEVAFVNSKGKLNFYPYDIGEINFDDYRYVKIDEDYFFAFKKGSSYDCIRLNKQRDDSIKLAEINDCIDFSPDDDFVLLVKNKDFYLWSNNTLYKYSEGRFSVFHTYERSGIAFENDNKFYLLSGNGIYLINTDSKTLTKLNVNALSLNSDKKIFKLDNNLSLITSSYWKSGEKYYVFESSSSNVTLDEYEFKDEMNLKEVDFIKTDDYQFLFFNKKSFEILSQKFNTINFYLFSYFY